MRRPKLLALFLALSIMTTSCIGTFSLTNGLYGWNESITNRFGRAGVFFAFVVIPVYGITLLSDLLIFNSIEFWGGSNPVKTNALNTGAQTTIRNGNESARLTRVDENTLRIERFDGDWLVRTMTVEKINESEARLINDDGTVRHAHFQGNRMYVSGDGWSASYEVSDQFSALSATL